MTSSPPIDAKPVEQQLRMARAFAAEQLPWFAPSLFAARLVVTDSCPTLAAIDDGMRIYFNPTQIAMLLSQEDEQTGLAQLGWIWVHEISHALREHGQRGQERRAEATRWNIAADLEINDATWENLHPPRLFPPVLPNSFGLATGKLAEYYYNQLPDKITCNLLEGFKGGLWGDEGSGVHGQARPWEIPRRYPASRRPIFARGCCVPRC